VFARLTPTMLVLALINPTAWLMLATGRTTRSLSIALLIAPALLLGYSVGLPGGPMGVATGFSGVMLLLAGPVVLWASHGTGVSGPDVMREARPSLISAAVAGIVALAVSRYTGLLQPVFLRLTVNSAILFSVFAFVMLFTLKDKSVYRKMLSDASPLPASSGVPD